MINRRFIASDFIEIKFLTDESFSILLFLITLQREIFTMPRATQQNKKDIQVDNMNFIPFSYHSLTLSKWEVSHCKCVMLLIDTACSMYVAQINKLPTRKLLDLVLFFLFLSCAEYWKRNAIVSYLHRLNGQKMRTICNNKHE